MVQCSLESLDLPRPWAAIIIVRMTSDALASTPVESLPPRSFEGAVRLSDWGLIRAVGEDAARFLQGQLTNDVAGLDDEHARLAGFCSAKGRLLASFLAWKAAPNDWLLACSADVLPATLKRLSMFVLRAKCKLSDGGTEFGVWGLAGAAAAAWLGEPAASREMSLARRGNAQAVRLADVAGTPRWLLVAPLDETPGLPALSLDDWRWLEVRSGVARIVAATAEAFVPQMVNFELVGGVSFKKGCYPGQEVVARSQYRGTLKRRGALLAGGTAMQPGQEVFQEADPGQPAGTIALAAPGPDGQHLALVELKLAALDAGGLHLGSADGPSLHALALPYAIPRDEH
jgi:tRNA-modifying protein YgfZ